MLKRGITTQTASEIVQEVSWNQVGESCTCAEDVSQNVWFGLAFNNFANSVPRLPVDHHLLAALVAPRGLFVIEVGTGDVPLQAADGQRQNTAIDWLGPESTFGCMQTAHNVFTALGVPDKMGFKAVNHPDHCGFPASIQPQLTNFLNAFLLNKPANTSVFTTDGNFNFNSSNWVTWTTPILS